METTKQKFTIEIERPTMDYKVTEGELYEIIGTGLHCFGQNIKITEEQLYEIKEITEFKYNHNTLELVKWAETHTTLEFWLEEVPQYSVIEVFDWLNKNHFDYRGLIPMGLAIDATNLNIYS